ncbi:uncharacterized protein M6B38_280015 [Iris pallida]|uniref:Uncharacterized protein n=1 Tax=Iris pallida TaxID=29817 RepID=A0AAX6HZ02_IRIPA|nr:uncharacterized protein M6B38_280015 [Iris pallida]
MSSVDHKCPQLTTNVLCRPQMSSVTTTLVLSPLVHAAPFSSYLWGPAAPWHSFARYQELPWLPYRGIVLGIPNQTYYPYLKPRYAKGNRSTNNPPVG